jgi:hypothetical protein
MSSRVTSAVHRARGRIIVPTVLIVDEDVEARRVAADAARNEGYLVETGDVDAALRVLDGIGGVSVVMADMNAPGHRWRRAGAPNQGKVATVALIATSRWLLPSPVCCLRQPPSSEALPQQAAASAFCQCGLEAC